MLAPGASDLVARAKAAGHVQQPGIQHWQRQRTHQIRVHLAHLGFPIAGDDKYGDFALNRELSRKGFKRMFLHAWRLQFKHPATGEKIELQSQLPADLTQFLQKITPSHVPA